VNGQTSLSKWLTQEMPRRGYPLQGPRAGGISRLASEANIPQATMSRLVHGQSEASVDNLRKLAPIFGKTLAEMMVISGLAKPDEMTESPSGAASVHADQPERLRVEVSVSETTMDAALKSVTAAGGPLTESERILVATLQAMNHPPAAVAGAVLLLRAHADRLRGQQGSGLRKNA
jgi:transcriptional regulator with XRE-family HTH domain